MRTNCFRFGRVLRSARAFVAFVLIAQLSCALLSGPASARGTDALNRLNRQIEQLTLEGEPAKAAAIAKRYVELARKTYGEDDPEFATAITWLGWFYQSQQNYAAAEPLLEQALAIREKAFGPDHPLVATSLNNLADLYEKESRRADAAPLIARAEAIRMKAVGVGELEVMPRRMQELQASGKTAEAAQLADRYVALATERYGGDQPAVVPALVDAALIFEQQGDVAKAEALLKQGLAIREKAFGRDSPQVADSLDALARLYQFAGRFAEAEPPLERALAIRKKAFGARNETVIETMQALAGLYRAAGRNEEAEKLFADVHELQRSGSRRLAYKREEPSYAVVKVFYATDRKNTGATAPNEVYGGDRGKLSFGTATVSIPRDHRMGVVETPSVWRLEWSADPERFVVLLSVDETDQAAFFKDVAARVRAAPRKSAFIFVHGYNVTFADAARRTAQMAYDLGFDGAPVFYSWPSQAEYAAYKVDETNAEWSRLDFEQFLKDFVAQSQAEHIYLIAHSMGTRVLTGALKDLVLEDPSMRERFDEIILAAPDIDAETFERDIAPKILSGERAATLYASSGDYALMASKTFAGYRRAGDTTGGITIAPGVDTIDASALRTDFVGHSYYADSASVIGDLRDLILHRKRAEKRARLAPAMCPEGRYWKFSAKPASAEAGAQAQ